MNFNGKIIVKSDTIFLNFDKKSQLFLLAFFNFFCFFSIFFAGFEKKRPYKIVGEPIFFVGKNSKISKNVLSKKKQPSACQQRQQRESPKGTPGLILKLRQSSRLPTIDGARNISVDMSFLVYLLRGPFPLNKRSSTLNHCLFCVSQPFFLSFKKRETLIRQLLGHDITC